MADEEKKKPWILRNKRPEDLHFVIHSWVRSAPRWWKDLFSSPADAARALHDMILSFWDRAQFVFACNERKADQIFGWVCFDVGTKTLHAAYVKKAFRGFGMFREMVRDQDLDKSSFPDLPGEFRPEMLLPTLYKEKFE